MLQVSGYGAGAEVEGIGAVVGSEGESVALDGGGAVDGGAYESPEVDGLARPLRHRERRLAAGAGHLGHQALSFIGTVGGDIDAVLTEGACFDIHIGSERYADAGGYLKRGGGENHRGDTSFGDRYMLIIRCDDARLSIMLHAGDVAHDEDVPRRCHRSAGGRLIEAYGGRSAQDIGQQCGGGEAGPLCHLFRGAGVVPFPAVGRIKLDSVDDASHDVTDSSLLVAQDVF